MCVCVCAVMVKTVDISLTKQTSSKLAAFEDCIRTSLLTSYTSIR